ncbi:glycosyltransferase family 4 protein [Psychrosphaera sp. 1_MG-2023]|uniref:glycosyltransferase family 4 protein n=1 Tax=Psychrosphaera sp. 1_MG-2023 TaxID=3062643 RepID=UPI0026E2D4BD|nr:glycosyltransferase family 4 protein [Psychrosphaera sp. 1_MG-2023]MDO6719344.1 glycosyltransferase family 4 protein [Psychrosphaera sp. 1_MG-2023]
MRILHVEAGKHLYGGALQVHYLTSGLSKYGIKSFLAAPRGAEIYDVMHGDVVPLPMKMAGDLDVSLIFKLVKAIRIHKIQLVHLHSRRGADLFGLIAAKLTNTPVVISRRVDNIEPNWFSKWKYHQCNKVITISDGIRNVLLDAGVDSNQVTTVLSAVDTDEYKPIDHKSTLKRPNNNWFIKEFKLDRSDVVIGVLAQFIPRKGHSVLFSAFKSLIAKEPNVQLLVFGKGPLEEELKQEIIQLGLSNKVQFCGFRTDLARILPNLNLVVHPAFAEGLGVSLLQANACGVPIIASRVGGIPEIVTDGLNGLLVDPGNVQELFNSLEDLVSDTNRIEQMAAAGREKVLKTFSIKAMVEGNVSVYKHCIKKC